MTTVARCRAGADALEFALVTPLFLALSFGTVELAHWAWGRRQCAMWRRAAPAA